MGVFLHRKLQPNENGYLVVCSTYERGQVGRFVLDVESLNSKVQKIVPDYVELAGLGEEMEPVHFLPDGTQAQPYLQDSDNTY